MRAAVLLALILTGCSKPEVTSQSESRGEQVPPKGETPPPKNSPPVAPPRPPDGGAVIQSRRELVGCADGEEITVRGKVGIGGNGFGDVADDLAGRPPSPSTRPLFNVTFSDGSRVTCAFGPTPRDTYAAWLKKNKPGTVVTVKGTYFGGGDYLIIRCAVLPNGFK